MYMNILEKKGNKKVGFLCSFLQDFAEKFNGI